LIQPAHVATKGTTLGNIPVFLFPYVRKRKTAERRFFGQNALPKKPPFRQRTAPRQMLNLSQWRGLSHIFARCLGLNAVDGEAFSFFSPTKGSADDLLIELHAHNKTAYQVANDMLSRTGKAALLRSTAAGKSFVAFQLCRERADAQIMWLTPGEYIWRMLLTYQKSAGSRVPENNPFLTHARSRLLTPGEGTARRRPHGRLDVKTGHVTERSNPLGSWPNEQKRSLSVV
jgi:hypothetical protein